MHGRILENEPRWQGSCALITFAYQKSGHSFLELQTRDAASLVDWLQWNAFTEGYLIAALAVLLIAVVRRESTNLRFLPFVIGVPTMPWVCPSPS